MKPNFLVKAALMMLFSSQCFAGTSTDGLPQSVLKLHSALSTGDAECSEDLEKPEKFDLGQGRNLYIVQCMMGAYQGSANAYITEDNEAIATPVMTLAYDELGKSVVSNLSLGEAYFDKEKSQIYTHSKGRGIGDCGQSSITKISLTDYGSISVRTTEIRAKSKCDGKMNNWPVVFKQK